MVQLAARDNDAVVLRRDGSVLTWGSFPADPAAYDPGDVTQPYLGGRTLGHRDQWSAAGVGIRKVLTEQGLFAALADDGAVYSWGVHFDMTARGSFEPQTDGMLRDIDAVRVLNLPPVRDLMPGGFIGYGQRTTDRLTAMAISYRGVLWKVRGRVAERYDPANPTQQRRPIGSARPDCKSCHVVLTDWPLVAPAPTSSATCTPQQSRPDVHGTATASLIHADTACEQCHNPSRTTTNPNFTGGWLNCAKPTDLPPRTASTVPPPLSTTCALPPNHALTPTGTVCASCHNSVIATPLACAQPSVLPTLATTASIASINGSTTNPMISTDTTPTLGGTLSAALAQGEFVRVLRNGTSAALAAVSGTTWSFTDGPLGDGTYAYTVRVEAGTAFGRSSTPFTAVVDTTAPQVSATIVTITDDFGGIIAAGSTTTDTTPTINVTLSGPLAAGESIQVVNSGATVVAGTATDVGTSWRFNPSTALVAGSYSFQARVVDAAGNRGGLSAARTLSVDTTLPAATIATVGGITPSANSVALASTNAFTISGTTGRALQNGEVVRIYRDGTPLATAGSVGSTSWSYASPSLGAGTYRFVSQVEQGSARGASALVDVTIDITAPSQTVTVSAFSDISPARGAVAIDSTSNDPTPRIRLQSSAALLAGEVLVVTRQRSGTSTEETLTASRISCGTNCEQFDDTPGVTISVPPASPSTNLPTYTYRALVRDAAGNVGPTQSKAFAFGYTSCVQPHSPARTSCGGVGCHNNTATVGGVNYLGVPGGNNPVYWCTR